MGGSKLSALAGLKVEIDDLPGSIVGIASSDVIWLDQNAAGHGWFLDSSGTPPSSKVDLLTVLAHEMGHVLGFEHTDSDDLMGATLAPGVRHTFGPSALVDEAKTSPLAASTDAHAQRGGNWLDNASLLAGRGRRLLSAGSATDRIPSTTDDDCQIALSADHDTHDQALLAILSESISVPNSFLSAKACCDTNASSDGVNRLLILDDQTL